MTHSDAQLDGLAAGVQELLARDLGAEISPSAFGNEAIYLSKELGCSWAVHTSTLEWVLDRKNRTVGVSRGARTLTARSRKYARRSAPACMSGKAEDALSLTARSSASQFPLALSSLSVEPATYSRIARLMQNSARFVL